MPPAPVKPARQRWLIPVLLVVISLAVGGGVLARELYRESEPPSEGPIVVASDVPLPPEQQPGPQIVGLTPDAAAHPEVDKIRRLLQTYFDAINGRNYDRWKTTVTRQRALGKPQADWLNDYRTTKDGSIQVYRIESGPPAQLQVLVGFSSTQDLDDAPTDLRERCVRWQLTLPMRLEDGDWRIDTVPAGTTPEHEKC